MLNPVARVLDGLLESIMPRRCVGCAAIGSLLCSACVDNALEPDHWSCSANVQAQTGLVSITTLGAYANPVWRSTVANLKFHGQRSAAQLPAQYLANVLQAQSNFTTHPPLLVPIPLHKKRRRQRGYNQAELIAHGISTHTGWPVSTTLLTRPRATKAQSGLAADQRQVNTAGAFTLHRRASVNADAQPILLIDDVITTGSTIQSAANTLHNAWPNMQIHVAAICHGTVSHEAAQG